jgi:hypothetical protein
LDAKPAREQQTEPAKQPAPVKKEPSASGGQQRGCPGTRFPKASCEAITAEATMRQVDVAREQADLARQNNWLNLVTALVAGLAAFFAARAAGAATKSYKAFVAAEDAHLAIEFPNGTWTETGRDGRWVETSYHLTIVITNIGRSTARVHDCTVKTEMVVIDKTLKRDESEKIPAAVTLDSLDPFRMVIRYTSPIRINAMLIVEAIPQKVRSNNRLTATVTNTYIVNDD